MADRKVINQYYPPDFDPSKMVPARVLKQGRVKPEDRGKGKGKGHQMNIRHMMVFTMACDTCGEYMWIGTKFNSRCERVPEKTPLGLTAWRFYGNCKTCFAEFCFRTDPESSDYVLESGGVRRYEAHKDADIAEARLKDDKEEEEGDSMTQLQNKVYDTAEEMKKMDALETLKEHSAAQSGLNRELAIDKAREMLRSGTMHQENTIKNEFLKSEFVKSENENNQEATSPELIDQTDQAELEEFRQFQKDMLEIKEPKHSVTTSLSVLTTDDSNKKRKPENSLKSKLPKGLKIIKKNISYD